MNKSRAQVDNSIPAQRSVLTSATCLGSLVTNVLLNTLLVREEFLLSLLKIIWTSHTSVNFRDMKTFFFKNIDRVLTKTTPCKHPKFMLYSIVNVEITGVPREKDDGGSVTHSTWDYLFWLCVPSPRRPAITITLLTMIAEVSWPLCMCLTAL